MSPVHFSDAGCSGAAAWRRPCCCSAPPPAPVLAPGQPLAPANNSQCQQVGGKLDQSQSGGTIVRCLLLVIRVSITRSRLSWMRSELSETWRQSWYSDGRYELMMMNKDGLYLRLSMQIFACL